MRLTINLATRADRRNRYDCGGIFNFVDDSVAPGPNTPTVPAFQLFTAWGPRIIGQSLQLGFNLLEIRGGNRNQTFLRAANELTL
jgi:hypothetical protein